MFKIAVNGPESTGKSTLTVYLSEYYNAKYFPEYARIYVENLARPYTYDDVCQIALRQIEEQQEAENQNFDLVFFDTDLIITKIWFQVCYNQVPDFVEDRLKKYKMDFYLLCAPDIEWKFDPVRENSDSRQELFDMYKSEIERLNVPYAVIYSDGKTRFENAIKEVNNFLKK